MAEEKDTEKVEEKEVPKGKSSIMKWVLLGGLVLIIGGGGFFGWRMFMGQGPETPEKAASIAEKKINQQEIVSIICPLESFIVNLMDRSGLGKRYLKTTIELEVADETGQEQVARYKAQLRDTILLLLTSQSFKEVSSIEGKLELKQALITRINQALGGAIVRRLYFTEFVVQ